MPRFTPDPDGPDAAREAGNQESAASNAEPGGRGGVAVVVGLGFLLALAYLVRRHGGE